MPNEYPSSGVHPKLSVDDPRQTASAPSDWELIAFVDNGACYDESDGDLHYKIARDYGATGYGVGGASGGTP